MRRPSHRKHNPQWVPGPRAKKWRDEEAARRTGVNICQEILKEMYPNGERPIRAAWVITAYKFGWLSVYDYYAQEPERWEPVPGNITRLMYEEFPLFKLIPKEGWGNETLGGDDGGLDDDGSVLEQR